MKGRTMQIKKRHLGILVLAMASIIALAFGAVAAHAEPGDWWPQNNTNTLIVNVSDDDDIVSDLGENVEVDLYLVATATPNSDYQYFDYKAVGNFESLGDPENGNAIPYNLTADGWMTLAQEAADIVYPEGATKSAFEPDFHAAAGSEINGIGDGIYLVLVHGGRVHDDAYQGSVGYDVADGYYAYNTALTKKYTFTPTLVALPNTETGDTTGEWKTSITIPTMKPEIEPLYGSLTIEKTLTGFVGDEPATFTFHIESTNDVFYGSDPDHPGNDRSITFTKAGTETITVEHIPAGAVVTVEEIHEGTRYQLASERIVGDLTIYSDEAVKAKVGAVPVAPFTNEPSDETIQGHGIENKFELSKTGEQDTDWDWVWTQVPEA